MVDNTQKRTASCQEADGLTCLPLLELSGKRTGVVAERRKSGVRPRLGKPLLR